MSRRRKYRRRHVADGRLVVVVTFALMFALAWVTDNTPQVQTQAKGSGGRPAMCVDYIEGRFVQFKCR